VYSGGDPRMMSVANARPTSHHSWRQPPPPPPSSFAGRPSQGPHHPSQADFGHVPSPHSSQALCGPSAGQHSGFVNVGRAPSHAADVVDSRQPSRRPSAVLPSHSLNPTVHSGQMVRRPSAYPQDLPGSRRPSAAVDKRPQQSDQRSQQHNGQRWQGIARKWDNYMAGGGYQ
jgi:hypothetical protein